MRLWRLPLFAYMAAAIDLLGYSGHRYKAGEHIPIEVGKLWSAKNQVPYSYYSLDVCQPRLTQKKRASVGGMLVGEIRETTPYDVEYMKPSKCEVLCGKTYDALRLRELENKIDGEYYVNLFADGLQGNIRIKALEYLKYYESLQYWSADLLPSPTSQVSDSVLVVGGYPLGIRLNKAALGEDSEQRSHEYVLFNHLDLTVRYNANEVVEFEITPSTRDWNEVNVCQEGAILGEASWSPDAQNRTIFFTYSVTHGASQIEYATRWDAYMEAVSGPSHTAGILNGFSLTIMLAAITAAILTRILKRDLSIYNSSMGIETDIEALRQESGWKLLHGDVFRKPRFAKLMACFLGTGVQLILMMFLTLSLVQIGFLSPTKRGFIIQTAIVLFFLLGIPAGYVSARFNRLLQPNYDKTLVVAIFTAFLYSGVCVATLLANNVVLSWKRSSGSMTLPAIVIILGLWLIICVPLVFVGSVIGYRMPDMELPCKTNAVARMVPPLPWYLRSYILCPVGGLIPFSATFGEFMMIANSVWQHKVYFLFGVLFVVCILLVLTSALISIIFTYSCISHENHRWWWRSWWSAGFSSVYLFAAFVTYYWVVLDTPDSVSTFMYFTYSAIAAYSVFLVTGASGTLASFWFLRKIFSAIKVA